jgi:hypothetical protein
LPYRRAELLLPFIALVFILYEVAEHFIIREDKTYTLGDIIEFCIGYTVMGLICAYSGVRV